MNVEARAAVVEAAETWKIAIKTALGKLEFPVVKTASIVKEAGFGSLAIELEHAVLAGGLPAHHGDPFDRMLIAQAIYEGLTIVTVDPKIKLYKVPTFDEIDH
jgi:PIN domain nuclease of toxin-antitoxin system